MSEQTATLTPPDYQQRAFLYAQVAPAPEEGDVLLYEGPLLNISEPAAAEFLGVPLGLYRATDNPGGDNHAIPPVYNVDGKEYTTANAAAVDFIVARMGSGITAFAEAMRTTVFVIRRRTYDSPETPEALQLTAARREQQNRKHGGPVHDDTHTLKDWATFMRGYMSEILDTLDQLGSGDVPFSSDNPRLGIITDKLIDVAALGVSLLESGLRTRDRQLKAHFACEIPLSDAEETVEPRGLKLTPYRDLKDKYVGEPGSPEREEFEGELTEEMKESQAHQERLLGLQTIETEADYQAVMQLLEQISTHDPHNLKDLQHLGHIAKVYEDTNGHTPIRPITLENGFQVGPGLPTL